MPLCQARNSSFLRNGARPSLESTLPVIVGSLW
jgi:hypothetical protein